MAPEIAIDFSDVPDQPDYSTPIPAGTYDAMVDKVELKVGKESGKEYLNFELHITDEGECQGRKCWSIVSLSDGAMPGTKKVLESFGLTGTKMKLNVDDTSNLLIEPDLVEKEVTIRVKNEMYEGEVRSRVSRMTGKAKKNGNTEKPTGRRFQ